jgi:peptidyl-prolyl cis-trans isomerase SurA
MKQISQLMLRTELPFLPMITAMVTAMIITLVAAPLQAALVLIDRIAVVVEQDVIMQSEIDERMRSIKSQINSQENTRLPSDEALQEQIIERLIVESLQLQRANRFGIRISDDELTEAMAGIAAQNSMNIDQFRLALEKDGVGWAVMREQIRRELSISRVQQGVMRRRIQVTEQEIENFLATEVGENVTSDQYRLGHILLALPDNPSAADLRSLRDRANQLDEQLQSGADFGSLAIEWSAGQNALEGGDMGWRKPAQLPTIFSDLVTDMRVGDVKGPIKSGRGFHLIKLVEKRGAVAEGQIAQTRVRHVLVKPNEIRTDEEAGDLAKSLRQEILDGRDFAEVAKLYSDDPGSALSGGDLGWARSGVYVPKFEATVGAAEIDALSVVIKTVHGYHFLEVTGRRIEDFSEQFKMGQAENYLRNQKFDEELEGWIREIRDEAFVEVKI